MKKRNITELQILAEILRKQPYVKQKEIADNLDITVQAVSEHIRNLLKKGYIRSRGRGEYVITEKGIRRLKSWIKEFSSYLEEINSAIYRYKDIWPAIAEEDLNEGDEVYLHMKDGLLHATKKKVGEARAKILHGGKAGEDVAITEIRGIIDIPKSKVIIFKIPPETFGGSRNVDYEKIKEMLNKMENYVTATMGTVGYVVAKKLNLNPDIRFAVIEGIVNACNRGCNVIAFITGKMAERVIKRLNDEKINYIIIDVSRNV
ncbi:hypothetical protein J422_04910 [Methanocaldococcus villosus KIN24-T80]|uniref:HTH crp-type domain-containing protein n=1 Tax=Methanocaldococcus villosus KIN24-T80 TaxID=1069083 RepID=N6UUD3_9EURY|nr:winged helix-turn-helix transcriptional regulator [Methanocaldococcus villosus]ENN95954.1 hypothetical protein J422_04910 [Methanocaldococcus villosus KIN24-T80]